MAGHPPPGGVLSRCWTVGFAIPIAAWFGVDLRVMIGVCPWLAGVQ